MTVEQILLYILIGFILFFFLLLALAVYLFRNEIRAFFKPDQWASITMIEADNNVSSWLQKKNPDLRFTFNEGIYNMFDISKGVIDKTVVYREGRLGKFFYIEGNKNPMSFRHLQSNVNNLPQIDQQLTKIDLSRLFSSSESLSQELLSKYGFYVITAIIILLLVVLFKGGS